MTASIGITHIIISIYHMLSTFKFNIAGETNKGQKYILLQEYEIKIHKNHVSSFAYLKTGSYPSFHNNLNQYN